MKTDDVNSFKLEDLAIPETTADANAKAKATPRSGQKAARKKGERFIILTPEQADKLSRAKRVVTVTVFMHLMFRGYRAGEYREPFVLPSEALDYAGIDRHTQARALRSLVELGLISIKRSGPKKPPVISLIGAKKRG